MANECLAFTAEECDFLELNVTNDKTIISAEVAEVAEVMPVLMAVEVVGYQRRRRKWCGLRMRRNRWGAMNNV